MWSLEYYAIYGYMLANLQIVKNAVIRTKIIEKRNKLKSLLFKENQILRNVIYLSYVNFTPFSHLIDKKKYFFKIIIEIYFLVLLKYYDLL